MTLIGISVFAQTSLRTSHTFGLIVVLFVNRYVLIKYMFIFSLSIKAFGKIASYAYACNEDPGPLCAYAQSGPVSAFASRYNARISFPTATKSSSRSRGASLFGLD